MATYRHGDRRDGGGFSLVELIIVLTIIAIISAVAVPGLMRMNSTDDEISRASRELFEMLSAARTYATTYNVRTAVVYNLDSYQSPLANPTNEPLPGGPASFPADSVMASPMRYINAAMMVYEVPNSKDDDKFGPAVRALKELEGVADPEAENCFVPIGDDSGQWKQFDERIAVLLLNPSLEPGSPNDVREYFSASPRYDVHAPVDVLGERGFYSGIPVVLDYITLEKEVEVAADPRQQAANLARFIAHVFLPDGRMQTKDTSKERFTFYVGYRPTESPEVRLTRPEIMKFTYQESDDTVVQNLRVIPIELYRSTGRVKIAS